MEPGLIVLAIDPGLDGAVCFLCPDGARVVDLPTVPIECGGTVKRRVHGPALYQIIMAHAQGGRVHAYIEDLSVGGQGSSQQTTGSQYRTRGTIESVLELVGLKVEAVPAKRWKALYGLSGKKSDPKATEKALELARLFYPELEPELRRKSAHNRAEAVLLAHWAMKGLT